MVQAESRNNDSFMQHNTHSTNGTQHHAMSNYDQDNFPRRSITNKLKNAHALQ